MGKVRQIFIWNGQKDLGPFTREELIEQLKAGTVLPKDYYYEEGMSNWERVARLPCCNKFLATDAQKQMLDRMGVEYDEFLTKVDVSSIMENQPATERQLDYLRSFGVTPSASLTKERASKMIEHCLDDPAARERQSQFRAAEFEKTQREREALPSYYLKQDVIASERELSDLKREHDEKRKELSQYERELEEIQQRVRKAGDEIERTALEQQLASTQELIALTQNEIKDQPTAIKEAKDELRYRQVLRTKFWKATFTQLGLNSDDTEALIDYSDAIDRLYSDYGQYFKVPTLKQVTDTLEALDKSSPNWDKQEPQSFYAKYKASFPDSVKRSRAKRAVSKQGCLLFAISFASPVLLVLIDAIWRLTRFVCGDL
jgi:hypothetical protein